jgi:hypothetical protein
MVNDEILNHEDEGRLFLGGCNEAMKVERGSSDHMVIRAYGCIYFDTLINTQL